MRSPRPLFKHQVFIYTRFSFSQTSNECQLHVELNVDPRVTDLSRVKMASTNTRLRISSYDK